MALANGVPSNGHSDSHSHTGIDEATFTGAPVCLIRGGQEGLRVAEEGLRLLESLHEPIAVVCLAGQYRTGKSFFLNQLATATNSSSSSSSSSGFRVGPTTESCTRGIWLWDPQPTVRNTRGDRVLFMDTEGIAATDNDESYDAKIFSLGLLLSSLFVFNTMGVIDEGAIDRLFLVSELTKHVCISSSTSSSSDATTTNSSRELELSSDDADGDPMAESRALAPHFPPFIWLLRDFMLDMQADGASLSPNEYLEKSLELRDGGSRRNEDRNKIRTSIRILFDKRECLTLVRPVMDELQLRRAAELSANDLRPEFVEQMRHVRDRILAVVSPKLLLGKAMDGRKLAHLAKCYTETLNSGAVPDIKAAWAYVSEATCQSAMLNAMELYDLKMRDANYMQQQDEEEEEVEDSQPLPVQLITQQEFEKLHKDAQDEALTLFKSQSVEGGTRAACFQKLKSHIQKQKTMMIAALQQKSALLCEKVLQELKTEFLSTPLARGQWDESFLNGCDAGDQETFAVTLRALEQIYDDRAQGPAKKVSFFNFLRDDVVSFFQDLFLRLSRRHQGLQGDWDRQVEQLQQLKHTLETQLTQQIHDKEMEIARLVDARAHAEEKQAMQQTRIQELQAQSDQQHAAIQALETKNEQLHLQLTETEQLKSHVEMDLEKTKMVVDHTKSSLQQRDDELRTQTIQWTTEMEELRKIHENQKEEWIQKLADTTAEKATFQKTLKHRDHELQQKTLAMEMAAKHSEQLQSELATERDARAQQSQEITTLRNLNVAVETRLEESVAVHLRLQDDFEREKQRFQTRFMRFETQLGSIQADNEVQDVLSECVTEVVRLAEVEKANVLQEERNVLQERLGELFLKISTLPEFYQREIFCSADPEPSFFDALTQ